ncbi:MAG: histidine kinase [Micropruina sp.]|uniref:sensor histidine kinase n=1 Tax=Micropruina sp. TaxID=2737536 RepID=UPI0039E5F5A5
MPRPSTAPADRVRRLLNAMFAGGLLAALGSAVLQLADRPGNATALLLLVVVAAAAWRFRATGRFTRVASLVLTLCGIGVVTFGDNLGLPLLFAALIVLVVDWSVWAGCALAVLMTAVLVALLHDGYQGDWTPVLLQSLANLALLSIVLVFGAVLRAFDQQHRELVAANARLTEAMDASRDLVLAQERARAAAELHDGLGHQLTLVSMSLEFAGRVRERDPAAAWKEVVNASAMTRQALADMRLWVRALHPARLEELTDPQSFEAVADVFRGTGLEVGVEVAPEIGRLDRPRTLFAYRLIQEALTNVLRHTAADRVRCTLDRDAGRLRVVVSDNGRVEQEPEPGFGLRGLTERARELGGTLVLRHPGRLGGLDVIAEVPLDAVPAEAA